ncbi:MAG: glycoside hydrolase family 9 protein [Sedimentisphaerales bacterium]|nr:glycoside hydrolase family 9 protein [Sedimentisphaerales bacterium]
MLRRQFCIFILLSMCDSLCVADSWIRINQLGYLPGTAKAAVLISVEDITVDRFQLRNAITEAVVYEGRAHEYDASGWGMKSAYRLDFSDFATVGGYYVQAGDIKSPCFRMADDVYDGTADFLLCYMRQQRCGYNPYLKDSCHLHDGIIVDHPTRTGDRIDVTGGWHDASDYLQYLATSANATYQMLFAWLHNPQAYGDRYDARGDKGENGVPDILDEARWGLQWLDKMNPAPGEMYNQIADDRDHQGYRLPNEDSASYGLGRHRPVYYITGRPQGLACHKNRTTGVSSSAAKFASAFALGARVLKQYDPVFADHIAGKAARAYEFALTDLGACQTACNVSRYFYEEENYVDDLELAACELHRLTREKRYLEEAEKWGAVEPVTPWMSTGRARHYQFYPFVNLGHCYLSARGSTYAEYLRDGLQFIHERGREDPFLNGIPFIWCSNNLVAAALTQTRCYHNATRDPTYLKLEAALRDWLFGCNPWGTSMICGLPAGGDFPRFPHSSITYLRNETTYGGLVDGPVYRTIFETLRGIHLKSKDEYAPFQNGKAVYHDDMGDYSSNEPTMDGTASLSFYLSSMEKEDRTERSRHVVDTEGAVVRMDPTRKDVYLAFTAADRAEGGQRILDVLAKHGIKASFFFTGNLLRNPDHALLIKRVIDEGHYVGPHSDRHLLYCDWKERDALRIDRHAFETDLRNNYLELEKHGVTASDATWFMPPYEWYNRAVVDWARAMGVSVVSFTPGVRTNADYTTADMANYMSSDEIVQSLFQFAETNASGLNGCILLIHPGTEPTRKDKLYERLPDIIERLRDMKYHFKRL